jgi:hypothetical protein
LCGNYLILAQMFRWFLVAAIMAAAFAATPQDLPPGVLTAARYLRPPHGVENHLT